MLDFVFWSIKLGPRPARPQVVVKSSRLLAVARSNSKKAFIFLMMRLCDFSNADKVVGDGERQYARKSLTRRPDVMFTMPEGSMNVYRTKSRYLSIKTLLKGVFIHKLIQRDQLDGHVVE